MSKRMTAVVAEDEALFREALVKLLAEEWPELEVVAQCEDGGSALDSIEALQPDVAFLDIRMPGLTGLDVAAALTDRAAPGRCPQIVFVTAYDQYAIDAFEKGVADYLLKPVKRERLAATIARIRSRSAAPDTEALSALLAQLGAGLPRRVAEPLVWLTASVGKETRLIQLEDVIYIQADNKYTVVMTAEGEALVRTPLRELLDRLDPQRFRQIHRGTIVNLKAIAGITRDESGRGTARLKGRPETLPISLTFMPLFRNM